MFTGLITDVGVLDRVAESAAGRELRITCGYDGLAPGESIAVNGACLTVRDCGSGWFTAAAVTTTLERTAIGEWAAGRRVNLERALRAGDRLGGHFVLGHVDAVGVVSGVSSAGTAVLVDVELPAEYAPLVVPHGSITIDGVSLTVNEIRAPATVQLSLIEFTLRHTTLGSLEAGARVHVEADVIGKYVQRLAAGALAGTLTGTLAGSLAGALPESL